MKPIHIYRYVDCEGPGFLQALLQERSIPFKLISIDAGQNVDFDLTGLSAIVFMGGNMSVNDNLPWMADTLTLIQEARKLNIPMLGHCLGGQLLSKALGASVGPNESAEIGWHEVFHYQDAHHELLKLLPKSFLGFHWHRETFHLLPEVTPLLSSKLCARQGYILNNIIGLQTHIEMTEDMVRTWVERFPQDLTGTAVGEQTADEILSNLKNNIEQLNSTARIIYQYWLSLF